VNYDFKALRQSSKEETIIMHANLKRSNIQTPRRLRHEELKKPQIQNTRIREIIREGPDIRIRMNRSQSLRIPDNVETISHRNSIYNSSIGNMDNIVEIDNRRPNIATAVYKSPSEFDPMKSQVLSVNYYSKLDKKLCPLTKQTVVWKTSSGSVIESEYPPKETIKIPIKKDLEVEATPYKDSNAEGNIEKRDIKKLHQQLNFTNIMLDIMKNQLGRMKNMEKVIK
ncbi:hypothetical protein S245_019710, partial [Arachis hypogaea]